MQRIAESSRLAAIERRFKAPIEELFRQWHWEENLKHAEIGQRVNLPRVTVTRWFRELGIPTQSCARFTNLNLLNTGPRKGPRAKPKIKREFPWKVNQSFFETWSEEMAYVLGFFVADGNLTINPRGSRYIEFTSCDRVIIEKIRVALGSNHAIGVKKRGRNPLRNLSECYRLQIGSKKLFSDLSKFGMVVCKSLVVRLPNIPRKYFQHFVRGYFDGDGHVSKGRKKKSRVIVSGFTSGGRKILHELLVALIKYGVVHGGSLYKADGFQLRFSVNDSMRLYKYVYATMHTEFFLHRKKVIFESFYNVGR